ncbi:acyl-CoA thioesterase [Aerococcus urinaeequi]|uniref:acyl-CoA thioesterase n=1 Tax=Aerococcus urinaeequi TaxID=51665 RepID=UPI00288E5D35|nr:acyl-CoA thioesterase [Aerococcus urinaeequi]MDT2762316.1 acyl-CoA thioesterase [Aerococcus urinaeequi]
MTQVTCKRTKAVQSHRIMPNQTNFYKNLYGGQILYIMDNVASVSAGRLTPYGTMTGNMDDIHFIAPLPEGDIAHVETYVTGAGKRSMEIFAKVIGEKHTGERYLAATAFLTYVVLKDYVDPDYHLPEVIAHTDEEVYLCNGYEGRKSGHAQKRILTKELVSHLTVDLLD